MLRVLLHGLLGTLAAGLIGWIFSRLAGESPFSAAFGAVVIGITCAVLAHFLSPWATPGVLMIYAVFSVFELWRDRRRDG